MRYIIDLSFLTDCQNIHFISGVAQLSNKLVQQWLLIVKGSTGQIQPQNAISTETKAQHEVSVEMKQVVPTVEPDESSNKDEMEVKTEADGISTKIFYKTSGKDGKIVIRKMSQDKVYLDEESVESDKSDEKKDKIVSKSSKSSKSKRDERVIDREKDRDRDKERRRSNSSSSSKNSSSTKHKSGGRSKDDKDRHRDKVKDRERDKYRDGDKDNKSRSNGSLKSSSSNKSASSSKDKKDSREKEKEKAKHDKEKQSEKDNNTLEKLKPPTIDKLGRIPKKSQLTDDKQKDSSNDVKKKFSVGIRKDKENDERPKTVKVFNSKMRSTGLEEEVKPAPSRSAITNKKPIPSVQLPTIPQKRPSPPKDIRESIVPPEKKLKLDKIDVPERPGAIKLIPPKPKREFAFCILFISFLFLQVRHRKARGGFQRPYTIHDAGALFHSLLADRLIVGKRQSSMVSSFCISNYLLLDNC